MPRRPKKKAPPSRIRYELSHPVVSARLSVELRDDLLELKRRHGLSMADVLKIGMERAEQVVTNVRKEGYADALGECLGQVEHCTRCYPKLVALIPDDV